MKQATMTNRLGLLWAVLSALTVCSVSAYCMNGGTAWWTGGRAVCACPEGCQGPRCEQTITHGLPALVVTPYAQLRPCLIDECSDDAKCIVIDGQCLPWSGHNSLCRNGTLCCARIGVSAVIVAINMECVIDSHGCRRVRHSSAMSTVGAVSRDHRCP